MSLSHILADLREAWLAVSFARPEWLALLAIFPVLSLLGSWSARRKAASLLALGQPAALYALRSPPVWGKRFSAIAYPLTWLLLVLTMAGPRWGRSAEGGIAVGRDLVIAIDVSRSMLANDMNGPASARVDAAKAAAADLLAAIERRGGHRVGIVVFAAKPVILSPLTTDYDHARAILESIDGRQPPLATRPGLDPHALSGTRTGAALLAAVSMHDARFAGSQDILLLSDGDDPVDDHEWRRGADAASTAKVPVHTIGFGDPSQESPIPIDGGLLDFLPEEGGVPRTVFTRLREEPLKAIAEETRGRYLPAQQNPPALGDFFRTQIEPYPSRPFSDEEIPQPRERYAWLLVPALLLFTLHGIRGE